MSLGRLLASPSHSEPSRCAPTSIVLNYDLTYALAPHPPTAHAYHPAVSPTSIHSASDDIALPLNYRNHVQHLPRLPSLPHTGRHTSATLLPFLLFFQLMASPTRLRTARGSTSSTPTSLYRAGIATTQPPCSSLAILSLVCMPTAVDDNWAQVCADILSYNPGTGGGGVRPVSARRRRIGVPRSTVM